MSNPLQEARWRLILGAASCSGGGKGLNEAQSRCDAALSFLYNRELAGRNIRYTTRAYATNKPEGQRYRDA